MPSVARATRPMPPRSTQRSSASEQSALSLTTGVTSTSPRPPEGLPKTSRSRSSTLDALALQCRVSFPRAYSYGVRFQQSGHPRNLSERQQTAQQTPVDEANTTAMGRKRTATRGCDRPQAAVQLAELKSHVWALWRSQEASRRVLSRPEDPAEVLREMKGRRTQATGTTRMDPTPNAAKTRRRWNISVGTTVAVVTMQNTQ